MAERQRRDALDRYYSNPRLCKTCGAVIVVRDNECAAQTRKRTFCSHSCSAKDSNKARVAKKIVCPNCGNDKSKTGKFCRKCHTFLRFESTLYIKTKGELLSERGYFNTRSLIQGHALSVYKRSGREFRCAVCNYDTYVEVCHMKPVADFSDNSTILEVNDLNNLITLCPNHHWELDHGIIKL